MARIANKVPWQGYEITSSFHPFACGLEELVHQQKGCYIGQEILARMRSRGRQGKVLSQVETMSLVSPQILLLRVICNRLQLFVAESITEDINKLTLVKVSRSMQGF